MIDRMQSRVYIGNFSPQGNVFVGEQMLQQTCLSSLGCARMLQGPDRLIVSLCHDQHSGGSDAPAKITSLLLLGLVTLADSLSDEPCKLLSHMMSYKMLASLYACF